MSVEKGDRVKATMNGTDWFEGIWVEERHDLFQLFGVVLDDGRLRYFCEIKGV